jgi:hypothetical protein
MSISYQWVFSNFLSKTDKDFPGNIIASVNYQLIARSGSAVASTTGVCHLGSPELADFIEFEDVRNHHLQEWVESALGARTVGGLKAGLAVDIKKQTDKPIKQLPKTFQMN